MGFGVVGRNGPFTQPRTSLVGERRDGRAGYEVRRTREEYPFSFGHDRDKLILVDYRVLVSGGFGRSRPLYSGVAKKKLGRRQSVSWWSGPPAGRRASGESGCLWKSTGLQALETRFIRRALLRAARPPPAGAPGGQLSSVSHGLLYHLGGDSPSHPATASDSWFSPAPPPLRRVRGPGDGVSFGLPPLWDIQ